MSSNLRNILHLLLLMSTLLTIDAMDPEIELCKDLTIDAAVIADDNMAYAFKGEFFWTFNTTSGISPNTIAKYIGVRWKGLTGPIDAAFTIEELKYEKCTVFIKENNWYLYKMKDLKAKGSTENWPNIYDSRVLAGFELFSSTSQRKDFGVFLFHQGNRFEQYVFKDIQRPTLVTNGKNYRKGRLLTFMTNPLDNNPGSLLSEYIYPTAAISTNREFIIYGEGMFCRAEYEINPKCVKTDDKGNITKFYGCPRSPFPTTKTTTTSTTTTTTPSTTTTTTMSTTISTVPETPNQTLLTTSETPIQTTTVNQTTKGNATTIGHPIITPDSPTFEPQFGNEATPEAEESTDKPMTGPIIAIVVIIGIICVIILFVILFFALKSNKKSKKKAVSKKKNKDQDLVIRPKKSSKTSVKSSVKSSFKSNPGVGSKYTKSSAKPSKAKKSTVVEADQMIDAIKSEDDI